MVADEIKLFMDIARQYHKRCLLEKNKFELIKHYYIGDDSDKSKITFYFGSDYDTWSFECSSFEYRAYSGKFIINFDEIKINELLFNLSKVNKFLFDHFNRSNKRVVTKRKLTFK